MTGGLKAFLLMVFFGFALEILPLVPASLAGVAAVIAVWVLALLAMRPREAQCIELRDDVVRLPKSWGSPEIVEIPYAELRSAGYTGKGRQLRLAIRSTRTTTEFPLSAFVDTNVLPLLREELYARLERIEGGPRLSEFMREQALIDERVWEYKPFVTYALCAVLAATFLVVAFLTSQQTDFALIRFGALVPSLVRDGQWWRLLSSAFLHANVLHVWVNGTSLFFLGALLERSLGASRFTVIYATSAAAGSVFSVAFIRSIFSVGASGAIFGLLGALAVLHWHWCRQLPAGVAQSRRWWIVIVGLNVAVPVMVSQIDYMAHVGGLLFGALTTWILVRGSKAVELPLSAGTRLRGLSIGCAALVAVACGLAGWHGREPQMEEQLAVAHRILVDASSTPEEKYIVAWAIAADQLRPPEDRNEEWLHLALKVTSAAIAEKPDNAHYYDAQSHLLYRLGRLDEAIAAEKKALNLATDDGEAANYKQFYYSLNQDRFEAQVRDIEAQRQIKGN
ncbi:MAG: rhomboid family intramembrane serine protease [Proteobacteria bacterium]|jgi:rhomboid protease GluP|nr:rhomboid family intramembrane serine protease [Pseudomonadota bacterium]